MAFASRVCDYHHQLQTGLAALPDTYVVCALIFGMVSGAYVAVFEGVKEDFVQGCCSLDDVDFDQFAMEVHIALNVSSFVVSGKL